MAKRNKKQLKCIFVHVDDYILLRDFTFILCCALLYFSLRANISYRFHLYADQTAASILAIFFRYLKALAIWIIFVYIHRVYVTKLFFFFLNY